jgi:thiol:disulfide interchange protein DsbG
MPRAKTILLVLLALPVVFLLTRGAISVYQQLEGRKAAPPAASTSALPPAVDHRLQTKQQRLDRARAIHAKMAGQSSSSIESVFTSATGLTGVVIRTEQGPIVAWMPDTHDVLIIGAVFDATGTNVSQAEMVRRGYATPADSAPGQVARNTTDPTAPAPPNTALLRSLEQATGFVEGRGGPLLVAVIDPMCAFCSRLWQLTRQPIAEGRLRVRWVPVAVVAEESRGKAAAILQSHDPVGALTTHETTRGGIGPVTPLRQTADALAANEAMLDLLTGGRPATPLLVTRGRDGTPMLSPGLPPDLQGWLAQAK